MAWIDYDSPTQILEVRLANGSTTGMQRPVAAVITVPKLRLDDALEEYVYVGFSGSTGSALQNHRLLAWNFSASTRIIPSPGPISAPEPSPVAAPPVPTAGRTRARRPNPKQTKACNRA